MTPEDNVDLVRRLFERHNDGGADAVIASDEELFHPELEWIPVIVGGPEGATYRGREGLSRWYEERDDSFEEARVEIETCTAMESEVVLVLGRSLARGRASGAEINEEVGLVMGFEDGLIRHDRAYVSYREAEEAARQLVAERRA